MKYCLRDNTCIHDYDAELSGYNYQTWHMKNLQLSNQFTKKYDYDTYAGLEIYVVGKYAFRVLSYILSLTKLWYLGCILGGDCPKWPNYTATIGSAISTAKQVSFFNQLISKLFVDALIAIIYCIKNITIFTK